jgi:hypothetical protein
MSLIVLILAYARRGDIRCAIRDARPPALGFFAVFIAGLFEVAMYVGDIGWLAELGVPLLMTAVAWAVGGLTLLRPLAIPLACVALMIPPGFLLNLLAAQLKPLVGGLAVSALQTTGSAAVASGYHVNLPGVRLVVTDSLCGVPAMLSLLVIVWVVTAHSDRRFWWRAAAAPCVVAVVVATNVTRLLVGATLLSDRGQREVQEFLSADFSIPTIALGSLVILGLARALRGTASENTS